jgi:hypothetical protein
LPAAILSIPTRSISEPTCSTWGPRLNCENETSRVPTPQAWRKECLPIDQTLAIPPHLSPHHSLRPRLPHHSLRPHHRHRSHHTHFPHRSHALVAHIVLIFLVVLTTIVAIVTLSTSSPSLSPSSLLQDSLDDAFENIQAVPSFHFPPYFNKIACCETS